ncbi:hypothetical protein DPMN_107184 [Dreissena polymorpha]|uniref:Uncharacterized protein n=1 Tax=Dreissena polymorpha TaxID=45954 RepID=A0A9D4K6E4_DREPO|nr:hypothetical protein DPMN_107184 [Dreissena polymorpha]
MEYGLNEQWDNLRSPVANRFITSYDESNSKLTMLNKFFKNLGPFNPDLVILSGLHLLEMQTHAFVSDKLQAVRNGLGGIPRNIPVHLELASMANKDCVTQIMQMVGETAVERKCSCSFNVQITNKLLPVLKKIY